MQTRYGTLNKRRLFVILHVFALLETVRCFRTQRFYYKSKKLCKRFAVGSVARTSAHRSMTAHSIPVARSILLHSSRFVCSSSSLLAGKCSTHRATLHYYAYARKGVL